MGTICLCVWGALLCGELRAEGSNRVRRKLRGLWGEAMGVGGGYCGYVWYSGYRGYYVYKEVL